MSSTSTLPTPGNVTSAVVGSDRPTLNDWNPGNGKLVQYVNRPVSVWGGAEVKAGYAVSLPFEHAESIVNLVGGSVQLDVLNPDGRSYTITVPFANNLAYTIPENDMGWFPSANQKSPLTYQGTATAGIVGSVKNIVFSAVGATSPPAPAILRDPASTPTQVIRSTCASTSTPAPAVPTEVGARRRPSPIRSYGNQGTKRGWGSVTPPTLLFCLDAAFRMLEPVEGLAGDDRSGCGIQPQRNSSKRLKFRNRFDQQAWRSNSSHFCSIFRKAA
ncbi:MAG TPA: hypothetical protein VMM36_09165 [Opitutaceae bacterium]|nr:hypothetical protein [Opitutaceae bacterium]